MAPVNCCSQQLYASCVTHWYSRSCMLTYQLAKHLSDFYRHPAHDFQPFLCCSGLSTASSERAQFSQQCECCSNSFAFVAPHPAILKTSRSWCSSFCCNKAKTVGHQNHLPSAHQLRHYMPPRPLAPSTKSILEASPLSLQPYLRLIRFDRPIGIGIQCDLR